MFEVVKGVFDKALEKSWMIAKSPTVAAKVWWESVLPSAKLILPEEAWRKCIYNNTKWRDSKAELREVVKTNVGQRIFAHAWREVADDEISCLIEEAVAKLLASEKEITQSIIDRHRGDLAKQCTAAGGDLFVHCKPRTIFMKYRQIEFPVLVTTFVEEFNLRVYGAIKEIGVQQGHVEPLFCESGLCGETQTPWVGVVDKKLWSETITARAAVQDLMDDPQKASGEEIKTVLTKHSRMLSGLDKAWKVETNFFLSQVGQSGEQRFESLITEALPTSERKVSLEDAHAKLKTLSSSYLYQFVRVGLQRQLESIMSWLSVMMRGRCPKLPETRGNAFLGKVVGQMAFFMRLSSPGSAGSGDPSEIVGREATVELFKKVEAEVRAKKAQDLQSLKPFEVYQWLLTAEEAKKTKEWVSAVVGESACVRASSDVVDKAKDKDKSKRKEKKKKKQTDAEQAKQAAEDCFK